jgi:predicted PurR-regulated permease PerM
MLIKKLGLHESDLLQKMISLIQGASLDLFSNITDMVSFSLKFIVNFCFMILILFSIFMEGPRLGEMVYNILPFPRDIEKVILKRLREVIRVLIAGNLAIMAAQGVFVSAGFLILGAEMPLLAGVVASVFSLIPVIGTSFVWIPAAIYFAVTGHLIRSALIAAWCVFWYLLLENLIKPKFFGGKLNFHPVIFFFLLIGSLGAFSLPGIIIGPVLLTLFYSLWEIYRFLYLEDPESASGDNACIQIERKRNKSRTSAGN